MRVTRNQFARVQPESIDVSYDATAAANIIAGGTYAPAARIVQAGEYWILRHIWLRVGATATAQQALMSVQVNRGGITHNYFVTCFSLVGSFNTLSLPVSLILLPGDSYQFYGFNTSAGAVQVYGDVYSDRVLTA